MSKASDYCKAVAEQKRLISEVPILELRKNKNDQSCAFTVRENGDLGTPGGWTVHGNDVRKLIDWLQEVFI